MAQSALYQQYSTYLQKASTLYQRPQVKASLEIILSVFAVIMLILFAIRPTLTNIATLQKKIADQEVVLKKADAKLGQLIKAEAALSENQNRLQLFVNAVPNNFDYFNISKRVEIIARENQVTLKLVRLPGSVILGGADLTGLATDRGVGIVVPAETGLTTIPVAFSVEGSQTQVMGFLRSLENMDMLSVIQNIRIAKRQAAARELQSGLVLEGTAWFYSINIPK